MNGSFVCLSQPVDSLFNGRHSPVFPRACRCMPHVVIDSVIRNFKTFTSRWKFTDLLITWKYWINAYSTGITVPFINAAEKCSSPLKKFISLIGTDSIWSPRLRLIILNGRNYHNSFVTKELSGRPILWNRNFIKISISLGRVIHVCILLPDSRSGDAILEPDYRYYFPRD